MTKLATHHNYKYNFLRILWDTTEAEFMNIHISLRFLGIILRVLKLEVCVWNSSTAERRGEGMISVEVV